MHDIKTEKTLLDKAIVALGSGESSGLETVYELAARRLYSVCLAITGNKADAEDALHDTMLRVCRYSSDYKSQNGAWTWLFTIARHSALDIVERRRRLAPIEDAESVCPTSYQPNPEAEAVSQTAVTELLGQLSEDERQTVVLRLYADLTNAQTARVTGVSPACAQKRYRRALEKLKRI